jgi:hypothetical protein
MPEFPARAGLETRVSPRARRSRLSAGDDRDRVAGGFFRLGREAAVLGRAGRVIDPARLLLPPRFLLS